MRTWRKMFTRVSEQGQIELVPGNWFSSFVTVHRVAKESDTT